MAAGAGLALKDKRDCRWDLVALGEVMLRFDPGEQRIAGARSFQVWEGGGEYNVARALRHCFRRDTAIVTALADNPVGRLVEGLMRQGGVDLSHVRWLPYDGAGRSVRNGLNFVERGFGPRAPLGCSDRGNTAVSQLKPGDIDWDRVFRAEGARWFHTGGIFAALSPSTAQVAREAMQAARRHGAVVSYDQNYRASLWEASGGRDAADAVNRELIPFADVLLGAGPDLESWPARFPNLKVVATTIRTATSASRCNWSAAAWSGGARHEARPRLELDVLDRVGSGDAFAAGLIYALLDGRDCGWGVECGAALGALTMATPGDSAQASLAEIEAAMRGNAGIAR